MVNVSVLLHLGDRKKVVAVPSNCADHYVFLSQTVEWTGERVQGGEDFQASHKDRIKAVSSIPNESSELIAMWASRKTRTTRNLCTHFSSSQFYY